LSETQRARIVIVGCGFGALFAARALRRTPAKVPVIELGRLRFGGILAWFAWMARHITVLIGFRNRLAVLASWIYSSVFFRRGSRLITRAVPPQ
jgi:NADH dehydrogenase FAD-containing subunit